MVAADTLVPVLGRRSKQERARQLTGQAASLLQHDRRKAEALYLEAVELDPELDAAWFDLGLIAKMEKRWDDSLRYNLRAAEILGEIQQEPAWWNSGIAATAVSSWDIARRAWRAFGLSIPDGTGEVRANFGPGAVRLNPETAGEVVWGTRIDPARIQLTSIPFPAAGHRRGDIVLHDGVPNGSREWDGRQWPVFDELVRWLASESPTSQASVSAERAEDFDELVAAIEAAGFAAEDWTTNVRLLCKQCSEGTVHSEHAQAAIESGQEHLIGLSGSPDELFHILDDWAKRKGRVVHEHYVAL